MKHFDLFNRKALRTLLAFAVLLALADAARYYFGSYESAGVPQDRADAPRRDENSLITIEGFDYRSDDLDGFRIGVTAKKAALVKRKFRYFRTALGRVVEMDEPVFTVRGDDGGITRITGSSALVDYAKKEVVFSGGCSITTPDNAVLTSDSFEWVYSKGYIKLPGEYMLKRGGTETAGRNAYVEIGLKEFRKIL